MASKKFRGRHFLLPVFHFYYLVMTLVSFFQELFRIVLLRLSFDRRTLCTIHDPGLKLVPSENSRRGSYFL